MASAKGRILFVLTSHDRLGDTGKSTGAFLSEVAHPYDVLTRAGYAVDFVSPRGGEVPFDPGSLQEPDDISRHFWEDEAIRARLRDTATPEVLAAEDYDGVFYAGGHGTMWDFPHSEALQRVTAAVYEAGGVVGAVCHGPAGLLNVNLSDGSALVAGREVSAFTTDEEKAVELDRVVPFLLDAALAERGARHTKAAPFQPHVVRDGRLVTGQNPPSAAGVGEAMRAVLEERAAGH